MRCIFRLFGILLPAYSSNSLRTVLCNILGVLAESEKSTVHVEPKFCRICLGILQFTHCDIKAMFVKMENAKGLAATISDLVKKEGYQIDSFSLEVSIPPVILENENRFW